MVCLSTVGESYEFAAVSVDTVTRYSPYLTERLECRKIPLISVRMSIYLDVSQAALSQKTSFEVAPDVDNVTVSISTSSKWKVMDMLQLRK